MEICCDPRDGDLRRTVTSIQNRVFKTRPYRFQLSSGHHVKAKDRAARSRGQGPKGRHGGGPNAAAALGSNAAAERSDEALTAPSTARA